MKKVILIFLIGLSTCTMAQEARFVSDGIVYGITSDAEETVEVLPYSILLNNPYSGAITIPQTVEYGGTMYTVTALGESAFEDCGGVSSIALPATIRSIGSYCFYNCNFTSLTLPDSLRSIGDHAFLYSRVGSLHLPARVEEYGDAAFWARNLTSITVDDDNPWFCSISGCLYSKDSLTLCVVPDGKTGTFNVPAYVRHIGRQAFGFNSHITRVTLPEGLETIGDFAFNICSALNNVTIPSTVTSIGLCPFSYCPQLTNLTIASGNQHYVMDGLMLYSINYDTLVSCHKSGATVTLRPTLRVLGGFENNTWVRNITIPAGVTDISDNCFNGCSFTTIALPEHMNSIGAYAFATNSNLTTVTMPLTLRTMGNSAFRDCMGLTSVAIPDSLRVIPMEAFNSCISLRNITWGNSVEEIGNAAFWAIPVIDLVLPPTLRKVDDLAFAACVNALHTVTFTGPVDTLGENVFRHADMRRLKLVNAMPPVTIGEGCMSEITTLDSIIIPCGSRVAYESDSYWGQFSGIFYEDCNSVEEVEGERVRISVTGNILSVQGASQGEMIVYDALGRQVTIRQVDTSIKSVDVSHLRPGMYMAVYRDAGNRQMTTIKFVKI